MLLIGQAQGMDGADRDGVGAALGSAAGELLQGHAIAVTAATFPAQAVQLSGQAPQPRRRLVNGLFKAVTARRADRHGELALLDLQLMVTKRQGARQARLLVQLQLERVAVFKHALHSAARREVMHQRQRLVDLAGQQRRQVLAVFGVFQITQAGSDRGIIVSRVAEAGQDLAQDLVTDLLRAVVGVYPVSGQAGRAANWCRGESLMKVPGQKGSG